MNNSDQSDVQSLLSTEVLQELAKHDSFRERGEISPDHQRMLAPALSALMKHLLAKRAAEQAEADELARYGITPGSFM